MYHIRLYPQAGYRAYTPYRSYNSYNSFGNRGYSLHVVGTPLNARRRRALAHLAAMRAQIAQVRLQAQLQAMYGANGLNNGQGSLYANPGVFGGQSFYGGYATPGLGYGAYTQAYTGYGAGQWGQPVMSYSSQGFAPNCFGA